MSNQVYHNDDLELTVDGIDYNVNVTAYGTYTHTRGTYWEPPEDDFEIDDVEAIWSDADGTVVEETLEMQDALDTDLRKEADWVWDDDYPEPPDDYYEERAIARWERELDEAGL